METTPSRLFYKIHIRGTTDSPSYFTISHHPQKATRVQQEFISTVSQLIMTKHLLVRISHLIISIIIIQTLPGPA